MPLQADPTKTGSNSHDTPGLDRFADRLWLLRLLGPEGMAELTRPLTDEQAARVGEILDQCERDLPVYSAIMSATDAELPAVVERTLSDQSDATDSQNDLRTREPQNF